MLRWSRRPMVCFDGAPASPVPNECAIVHAAIKTGLEALERAAPSACRPILTATARDGVSVERPG